MSIGQLELFIADQPQPTAHPRLFIAGRQPWTARLSSFIGNERQSTDERQRWTDHELAVDGRSIAIHRPSNAVHRR